MDPIKNSLSERFPIDENLDFKRYLSLFISNWYWFVICLFIALAYAYGINRYSEKIYTVSSTLLIKDDQIMKSGNNSESVIPGGDIFKSQQNLKNEMGILKSFRLNDSVMSKLQDFHVVYVNVGRRGIVEKILYKTCPFVVTYDSLKNQPSKQVMVEFKSDSTYSIWMDGDVEFKDTLKLGERYRKNGFDFTLEFRIPGGRIFDTNNSNKYYFSFNNPESLANAYRSKLSVAPIDKEASIVTLSVTGLDILQEADYLNMLMAVYIDYGLQYKKQTAINTIEFIDEQIKIISDSLSAAENDMERFRRQNRFINITAEGAIIQNRLERVENEKTTFDLQLNYYNYLSDYLSRKDVSSAIVSPSVMGITDELIVKLVNELSTLQAEKEKISFNFSENQMAVNFIDKQILKTKEALKENISSGIANLKLLIAEAGRKIIDEQMYLNRLPAVDRDFIKIQRTYDLNNTVYTYLLEKRAESGIAMASKIADNRVIDYASPFSSGLIMPKSRQNLMLAFILGLLIPMVTIFLIDYFNDKVIDKRDIEKKTFVPVIGFISHSEEGSQIPVSEKPGSSLSESFRAVRTSLKFFMKENEVPVISVSSTISAEGKTFISINLAAITAMLGKKVLLIGLDLRKPRINKVFSMQDSDGMSTYLSGNCNYEEVIKETQIKNLFYAPSGPVPPNPAELIDTENMKIFIEKAKKEFDYIIIDTPPVAIVTDALLLAKIVDINIFIVRQRYTSRNTLEMIEQLRLRGELKNMAILINDINVSGYYGYGMRYGYSFGFGYSYGYNYYNKGYSGRYGYFDKKTEYYTED